MGDTPKVDPKLREAARRIVRESRLAQGLPPHIEDPAVLAMLARMVLDSKKTAP